MNELAIKRAQVEHPNLWRINLVGFWTIVRKESRRTYVEAIGRLQARGAEAVILGCTEIGMLIDDSVSPLPTYDTTALHAAALVAAALG